MHLKDLYEILSEKNPKLHSKIESEVSPALASIVQIILIQLKNLEYSTYSLLQLMSLLPTYNNIEDLCSYWKKIDSCSNLSV